MLNKPFKYKIINRKAFLAVFLGLVFSQSFAQYEVRKYSINSGGSKMKGGTYEMKSSIGQNDASDSLWTSGIFLPSI